MIGTNAEIYSGQIPEAMDRQSCSGQKCQRQRKFHHYQRSSQLAMAATRAGASSFFQSIIRIYARSLPCGRATEQDCGQHGCYQREYKDR